LRKWWSPADSVIAATGQRPEPIRLTVGKKGEEVLKADPDSFSSSMKGLYVAGDYLTGPSTVIQAVGMGRRAAEKIVRDLTGKPFREKTVRMEETEITDRKRAWDYLARREMPTVQPVPERFRTPRTEVETGLSPEQAQEESKRCYLCYLHYEIDRSLHLLQRYRRRPGTASGWLASENQKPAPSPASRKQPSGPRSMRV
jgi:formate dehydrogenase major subunit